MPIIFTHFWAKTETETIFCFGQYRNRNRKGFYSFGKTDIRPKWPKFGRKPKPNLFLSYPSFRSIY